MTFREYAKFSKPKRKVDTVFVHCSATDNPACDNPHFIYRVHVRENKWADIGYHYYIDKAGKVFCCRPLEKTPAAQAPFNRGSIAICLGGLKEEKFTTAQFVALRKLCADIDASYNGQMRFRGHCEVSAKTCPVFDYKKVLRLNKRGQMMEGVPTIEKLDASKSKHMQAARKTERDGDVAVGLGGGAAVVTGVTTAQEVAKTKPLESLKNITNQAVEFKGLALKASEFLSWALSLEGALLVGGSLMAFWGWRKWRTAKALKAARLHEEPKLKRLQREAAEAYA